MERTLLIIKPDAVAQNVIGEIIRRLEESDFRVAELKKVYLTPERAAEFYAVHKERPFYNDLLDFMTSGPCVPIASCAVHRAWLLLSAKPSMIRA